VDGVKRLLQDHRDVFTVSGRTLGVGRVKPHRIDTGSNASVKQRTFSMSVISESKSPWSSPVVLVTKKNGDVRPI
jgi:hypothetical protein